VEEARERLMPTESTSRVSVVTNGVDLDMFQKHPHPSAYRSILTRMP
jgi:hypothetical protein